LLDIRKTPIIVAVEVFVFSTVYYDGSLSKENGFFTLENMERPTIQPCIKPFFKPCLVISMVMVKAVKLLQPLEMRHVNPSTLL
ncbi:hypothetical protein, partial [Paenibacillus odorifer]|uniref:hypothetical protein n=1 Tax=Paenibacillus odorifer TaxID=189426 RepID=UPI00097A069E